MATCDKPKKRATAPLPPRVSRMGTHPHATDSGPLVTPVVTPQRASLVETRAEFLERWLWEWFCTLTFHDPIHPEAADKRLRVFVSEINCELFGRCWRKRGQGVRWVRAMEMQRRGAAGAGTPSAPRARHGPRESALRGEKNGEGSPAHSAP